MFAIRSVIQRKENNHSPETRWLGLDVGSVSLNVVLIDAEGRIEAEKYVRLHGQPLPTVLDELKRLRSELGSRPLGGIGLTGTAAEILSGLLKAPRLNEIIAISRGARHLFPSARTLIDIGGEDAKGIFLRFDQSLSGAVIDDFVMNSICAAGTGSFLDQQANRLGLDVEELGDLALKSLHPPRIAGRCSVFAKTDMIHLQQEGASDCDIVAGLCLAMARNFKSIVARGKSFTPPVVFIGGVAANRGMVRALRDVLDLGGDRLVVPPHFTSSGAVGAALQARDENGRGYRLELEPLEDYLARPPQPASSLPPLRLRDPARGNKLPRGAENPPTLPGRSARCYLGIDVGSISTKAAAIDPEGKLLAGVYLRTSGRPLEAVRELMRLIAGKLPEGIEVLGVGTTGSGRYLIGDFVGADVVKNEISAQAIASARIDTEVDTIFEIGGQDSKYISLKNGAIVDFEMNKVCAAGTGSFLEEQAEKLDLNIEREFGELALKASRPSSLGERCTVFMETDLVHHQQKGESRENLVAGLSYSIALNYLNRVVGEKRVGDKIFFQGAVAFNAGVVAAFEELLKKTVTVPPHPHLTGAVGAALWSREGRKGKGRKISRFKGFQKVARCRYEQTSFECSGCPNRCTINRVTLPDSRPLFYGSRCEKYELKKDSSGSKNIPDLFSEREKMITNSIPRPRRKPAGESIGIPRALLFHELLPLWQTFFQELGYRVVLSDITHREIIRRGLEGVVSETCFPVKVAHGHVLDLLNKGVDMLFIPMLINREIDDSGWEESFNCPYIQSFPYLLKAALDLDRRGVRLLTPTLAFGWKKKFPALSLLRVGKLLGKSRAEVRRASAAAFRAQSEFNRLQQMRGAEMLEKLSPDDKAVVMVSRPYNGYDPGLNLNLPRQLAKLGILAIPMDFLPLEGLDLSSAWPNMYWRYGQRILQAARFIRHDPRLYALYLTNFGCGPDSFIQHFFAREMEGKPSLQIEVDEHSADVGVITRCEAFWDSIHHARVSVPPVRKKITPAKPGLSSGRLVYIPYMSDASYLLAAAFRSEGISARVFPPSNDETLKWGRKFTSGKECYPCIVTTGDMIRITRRSDFRADRTAFFMPSTTGPCRFGQYCHLQRMILDQIGFPEVPILSPVQGESFYREMASFGAGFFRRAWRGLVAADLLDRIRRERRPYEKESGSTERAYRAAFEEILRTVEDRKDLFRSFPGALSNFEGQELENSGEKPVVGIVGEIFVRNHPFSNDFIIDQIEELGGEVWLPPVREWLLHINRVLRLQAKLLKKRGLLLKAALIGIFQRRDEKILTRIALPYLRHGSDTEIEDIWKNADPYLPAWFGEASLSAGKSVDYAQKKVGGIVNVMPFTCLPGTIFSTVLHRLRKDFDNIPALNLAFDGLQQTTSRTRIEAFMHQARQRHAARGKVK